MKLCLVAAMASNRVIGRGNALPWRLPPDLRRFKQITMGGTLVMGRRTFESIGRPLPGRTTIVVTRRAGWAADGVVTAPSIDEALRRAPDGPIFIAGGAEIFAQTIGRADRIHLTLIERDYDGDAFFPRIDPERFRLALEERHGPDGDQPGYRFQVYDRIAEEAAVS